MCPFTNFFGSISKVIKWFDSVRIEKRGIDAEAENENDNDEKDTAECIRTERNGYNNSMKLHS